jgi:16S rRNA (cytidine1402-2'-O)-methyltransferase
MTLEVNNFTKNISLSHGLYVVATPIGNLQDITLRALDILKKADIVLCEDTRQSKILFQYYGFIPKLLMAYHDHSDETQREKIINELKQKKSIALITDAGTPLISDPGFKLIRAIREENLPIYTIPGASSVTAALSICGLPTNQFSFLGFIPKKENEIIKLCEPYLFITTSLIFFERASRLNESLKVLLKIFNNKKIALCRELTKKFEEVWSGSIENALHFTANNMKKGELVIIVYNELDTKTENLDDLKNYIKTQLKDNSVKDIVHSAMEIFNFPKKQIYQFILEMKKLHE